MMLEEILLTHAQLALEERFEIWKYAIDNITDERNCACHALVTLEKVSIACHNRYSKVVSIEIYVPLPNPRSLPNQI